MPKILDAELETYERQRDHLLATAENKFVLIHEDKVAGVYDSRNDALAQGYAQFGMVPFLVKQIVRVETPENFVSNLLGV